MASNAPRTRTAPQTPFAARVQRALAYANLSQTQAAKLLSTRLNCKIAPAVVQHMAVKGADSKYTTDLAAICGVDPEWLASNNGIEPGTGTYAVREPSAHHKPKPVTSAEKLAHLIDARAISERDMELLLQMAERMAKHAKNGA